ncbi:MAG: VanZ family protein [Acidobacteria bacterium]|jgi:VanZ family protein|nr:VanZ family protein [Acidobacteriota bacterium]
MRWRRFVAYWLPPILYLGLIFALSSMSSPPVPKGINQDFLHYPEYAVLGFLLARALQQGRPGRTSAGLLALTVGLCAIWGVSDEMHQAFVPGRVPDLLDLWHDFIGACIGAAAFGAWKLWRG